jgi:hypothetical protein
VDGETEAEKAQKKGDPRGVSRPDLSLLFFFD